MRGRHMRLLAIGTAVAGLFAAGCGSDGGAASDITAATSDSTPDTSDESTTTSEPPTTELSTTTSASTTTTAPPAPTSTAAPVAWTLAVDGIGPVRFGDAAVHAVATLSSEFGAATIDRSVNYPVDNGDGTFSSDDQLTGFVQPSARYVCWGNNLCIALGGADPASLKFLGWQYDSGGAPDELLTVDGIDVGDLWSAHIDTMTVGQNGCFTVGGGSTRDGINMVLLSNGDLFGAVDDAGNPTGVLPDPATVVILTMTSGSNEFLFEGDC